MERLACQCVTAVLMTIVCASASAQILSGGEQHIKVDEILWLQLSDEAEHHMGEAAEDYRANNSAGASQNLRKAIVFLRIDAANSGHECRDAIQYAADDLLTMAHRIENGMPVHIEDMERAFARAEHAIAENHCSCAKQSWLQKQNKVVGYRMRAAGAALERAANWSGQEIDAGFRMTLDDTKRAGAAMAEGRDYVVDEIGKGLASLGDRIAATGRRIER